MYSSTTCPCCRGEFNQYEHIPALEPAYDDLDVSDIDMADLASTLLSLNMPFASLLNPYAEPFIPG